MTTQLVISTHIDVSATICDLHQELSTNCVIINNAYNLINMFTNFLIVISPSHV